MWQLYGQESAKLAKWCTGKTKLSKCMKLLIEGRHPYNGTWLSTIPRRVTKRDAGHLQVFGNAMPCDMAALRDVEMSDAIMSPSEARAAHWPNPSLMCMNVDTLPQTHCTEDELDPLGLGVELV